MSKVTAIAAAAAAIAGFLRRQRVVPVDCPKGHTPERVRVGWFRHYVHCRFCKTHGVIAKTRTGAAMNWNAKWVD